MAVPNAWGELNYKLVWFHDGTVSGGSFDWYPYIVGQRGGGTATFGWASNATQQGSIDNWDLAYAFDFAGWNTWEFWIDVPAGQAEIHQTNSGGQKTASHSNDWTENWDGTVQFTHADIQAYCSHDDLGDATVDVDDIYLATGPNARARVLLSQAPMLDGTTAIALCPTTAWSDGSITFNIPDSLPLSGLYLLVVKGDGSVLNAGQFQ